MNLEAAIHGRLVATGGVRRDLTHCPAFVLGSISVEPARRLLRGPNGQSATIQPLAMRVLIALAEANEATCSRDDLGTMCWGQNFVGDDALHRVISNLRRDLAQTGDGTVTIDTVAKVGYRLRRARASAPQTLARFQRKPVRWVGVGLVLALGGVAVAGIAELRVRRPPEVVSIAVVPEAFPQRHQAERFAQTLVPELSRLAAAMPLLTFIDVGGSATNDSLLLKVALTSTRNDAVAEAHLVEPGGAVVWSRDFAVASGGLDRLRDEVAYGVAGVVQCGFERSASVFKDPVTLRLYLGACDAVEARDWPRARAFAQQIVEIRPESAASWACLAMTTIHAAREGRNGQALIAQAQGYVKRALELDSHSGLAWQAKAMALEAGGQPILGTLEKGIKADPDHAGLQMRYAIALMQIGYVRDAVEPVLRALALQPHDEGLHSAAFAVLIAAGRVEGARAIDREMDRLWPDSRSSGDRAAELLVYSPDARTAVRFIAADEDRDLPIALLHENVRWRADPTRYQWARFDELADRDFVSDPEDAWRLRALGCQDEGCSARYRMA